MIWGGRIFHDDKDARCRLLEGSISCPKNHIKLTARLWWWFFESFFYLLSPRKLRKMHPSWLILFWKTNVWLRPLVVKSTSSIQDTPKTPQNLSPALKVYLTSPILSILTSQPGGYVRTFNHNRKTTHQVPQVVGGCGNRKQKAKNIGDWWIFTMNCSSVPLLQSHRISRGVSFLNWRPLDPKPWKMKVGFPW